MSRALSREPLVISAERWSGDFATRKRVAKACHRRENIPVADSSSRADVTALLCRWSAGGEKVPEQLMPLVYQELRDLARRYLQRERGDHTLQPTALVHEAYLRMVDQSRVQWQNRAQFFGIAAQLMRRILVDHARAHVAAKRGGNVERISLEDAQISPEERAAELVELDAALAELAAVDDRKSRIVELRFFGGLSIEEASRVMGISPATAKREWRIARAWLQRELTGGHGS